MARRRFFVPAIRDGMAEITGDEARHLSRVLRAEPGQRYEVSDNCAVYLAEVAEAARDRVVLRVLEPLDAAAPPANVALYAALIKFDRFEWIVEKATELGVSAIVPVEAARSEKGLLDGARKRLERWRRIAHESSQQSRRARVPELRPPQPLQHCVKSVELFRFRLEEEPGAPPLALALPRADRRGEGGTVALLVGPEGGWTDAERQLCAGSGWAPVSLGAQILRAETAAVAALAVLMHTWWAPRAGYNG